MRIYFISLLFFFSSPFAYAGSGQGHQGLAANFMYEIGLGNYYGRSYKEAVHWFEKVLLVEPGHKMAREYLGRVRMTLIERAVEEAEAKLAEERRLWVGEEEVVEEE